MKLEKLSILIVEDIEAVQKLLAAMCRTMGIGCVHTTDNAEEAFNLFCKYNHDIVITDWHMPGENGMDLVRKIRTSDFSPNKMAPVIMLTGYSSPKHIHESRDIGVTEYMIKPFQAQDLVKRIVHVIKTPRDYIHCQDYFGPDRRRRNLDNGDVPKRRNEDSTANVGNKSKETA